MDSLFALIRKMDSKYLPKGAVGKVICYALNSEPYVKIIC